MANLFALSNMVYILLFSRFNAWLSHAVLEADPYVFKGIKMVSFLSEGS